MFIGDDNRGKHPPGNKTSSKDIARVKQHIERFPTVESHYTRRHTRQKLTIAKMHLLYSVACETDVQPVKEYVYRDIFNSDYNLGFYPPKKKQCDECTKFDLLKSEEKEQFRPEYETHLMRKNEAQKAKADDKERAKRDRTYTSAIRLGKCIATTKNRGFANVLQSKDLCLQLLCL